tara:strand:- start:4574 stop:4723 length:150 start_codon:yes stop_codon:yes gene_type:complete
MELLMSNATPNITWGGLTGTTNVALAKRKPKRKKTKPKHKVKVKVRKTK